MNRRASEDVVLYTARRAADVVRGYFRSFRPEPQVDPDRQGDWFVADSQGAAFARLKTYAVSGGLAPPAALQAAQRTLGVGVYLLVPIEPAAKDQLVVLHPRGQTPIDSAEVLVAGGFVRVLDAASPFDEWVWWQT